MTDAWQTVKDKIQSELPRNTFSLWISPISFLDQDGSSFVLGCPNKFSLNWVTENYLGLIRERFAEFCAHPVEIVLKVASVKTPSPYDASASEQEQLSLPTIPAYSRKGRPCLNGDFTFERFIVGRCNEFAYSASNAFANGDLENYQTLFLLANTGLGKTHLSQAVGNRILDQAPEQRVHYITAENFTNEMIFALKNKHIEEFKNKYRRACDVLLLEEVHFLSGKEKTQVELGFTLDALTNDKKKVIFTSSLPPRDIPSMSKELSSRLTSGLVTTIENPDYETRLKILAAKASEIHLIAPPGILEMFAGRLTRDIRQMESALKCLKARSELLKASIGPEMAKEVLHCFVSRERAISLDVIQSLICSYYKVEPEMLRSPSRKKAYAHPRSIYAYLCRRHTDKTLDAIGAKINRSHSTVLYASELVERRLKTDQKLRSQVDFLSQKLEQPTP